MTAGPLALFNLLDTMSIDPETFQVKESHEVDDPIEYTIPDFRNFKLAILVSVLDRVARATSLVLISRGIPGVRQSQIIGVLKSVGRLTRKIGGHVALSVAIVAMSLKSDNLELFHEADVLLLLKLAFRNFDELGREGFSAGRRHSNPLARSRSGGGHGWPPPIELAKFSNRTALTKEAALE